jgi:hypothetical protein
VNKHSDIQNNAHLAHNKNKNLVLTQVDEVLPGSLDPLNEETKQFSIENPKNQHSQISINNYLLMHPLNNENSGHIS